MAYSKLSEELFRQAAVWAGKWTKLANARLISSPTVEGKKPQSLKNVIKISTHVDRKSAQRFTLVLTAKGKGSGKRAEYGHGAAIAGAYEHGAKEHIITPKPPKKYLIFEWERMDTTFVGMSVDHPGITAADGGKGYIYWSAYDLVKLAKKELGPLARKAIVDDLQHAFKDRK